MTQRKERIYRGKGAEDRSAERRARFIEAGLQLFGTQGFNGTTVRALCAEAGLTERYFYESFENREALFMEVASRCVSGLMSELIEAQAKAGDDPDEYLRASLDAFFRWFHDDERRARVQLFEPLVMGPSFHVLYREVTNLFVAMLRTSSMRWYEEAIRAEDLDADLLATALVGAAIEIVKKWVLDGFRQPLEEVVRTTSFLFHAVTDSLAARSPSRAKDGRD